VDLIVIPAAAYIRLYVMNLKIEGLKRFDGILGGIACSVSKLLVSPRKKRDGGAGKILVIRPGGIGDAALLYPALSELRNHFPGYTIDVLAEKRNSGVFTGCPYIDGLLLYDRLPHETFYRVISASYDIVIDTEQWHRMTSALSYLTRAPERIGFGTNERAGLYSHIVPYGHDDYEAQSFLNLVSTLTGEKYEFDKERPFLPISILHDGLSSAISDFRKGKRAVVGIFTGATVPERRWGAKKFAELAGEFSKEGIGSVVVGGVSETKDSELFDRAAEKGFLLDLVGKTKLNETAAVISELDLFISGDTGLMHIAFGVGTPTLSLFGAGIQEKWAPRGDNHIVINRNEPCSPCTQFGYTPKCPYGVRCLAEISVKEVKASAMGLLDRPIA